MPTETSIAGVTALQWPARTSEEDRAQLVGCAIDDGISDRAWTISAVRPNAFDLVPEGTTGPCHARSWAWLGGKQLLVPADRRWLLDAIDRSRPAHEKELDAAKAPLRGHRFDPDRFATTDDIRLVDQVLTKASEKRIVPTPEERRSLYDVVKRCGQERPAIPLFRTWMEAVERHRVPMADILGRLHLAVLLRHTGALQESLQASEVLDWPSGQLRGTQGEIGALSLNRAATMLDVYEYTGTAQLLQDAEKHLKRAWASSQSDEAQATYARWRSLNETRRKPVGSGPIKGPRG